MASKKELRALITLAGKIDPSLSTALMKASGESAKLHQKLNQTNKGFKDGTASGSKFGSMLKASFIGNLAANAVGHLASKIKDVGAEALNMASDLTEVQNVVDVAFGSNASQIDAWSKTVLKNYGITELQAKNWSGSMGAMLKSSGIAQDDIVTMSTDLAGLSGDFASFYNLDHDTAWEKIRSGISGETEPLKQLGLNMSVANLEQFAMNKGIVKSYKDMTQAEQTLLRYNYLVENTSDAQGDFSRTLDESWENQKRLLQNSIMEKAASALSKFIPLFTTATKKANDFVSKIDMDKIFQSIGKGAQSMEPLINYWKDLSQKAIEFGVKAKPYVVSFLEGTVQLVQKLAPYMTRIVNTIISIGGTVISMLMPILTNLWAVIEPIIFKIADLLAPLLEKISAMFVALAPTLIFLGNIIINLVGAAFETLSPIIEAAIGILGGLIDFITGVFTGNWKLAWDGITSIFSNIFSGLKEIALSPIKAIIHGINAVIKGVNTIKLPGGSAVNIPLIPMPQFALGGIATQASIFGEAGPEMAIPLKRTPRSLGLLQQTAQILGFGGKGGGNIFNININGGDLAEVKRVVLEVITGHYEDEGRVSFG